jgi:hypothetical protein
MRIKGERPRQRGAALIRELTTGLLLGIAVLTLQAFSPGSVQSASAATFVSGTITTTTWSQAGSPYLILDAAVVPAGNTLTIDPGVEVSGGQLTANGTVAALANSGHEILLNGVKLTSGAGSDVDLSYCLIDCRSGGGLGPAYGSISVADSAVLHAPALVIWNPTSDCVIERSVFRDCDRLQLSSSVYGSVHIRHNLFYKARGAVESLASVNGEGVSVEGNTFVAPAVADYPYALRIVPGQATASMDGRGNYWETTDTTAISARIYDRSDDLNCVSYIPFEPFLTGADTEAPTLDLAPPTIVTGLTHGGWYNFQTLPATSVPDQDLARLDCLLDGHPWTPGAQVAEGGHTYTAEAWDTSLNIAETSVDFGVDRTPPTTTTNADGEPHRLFTLVLSVDDTGSGVADVQYCVDGGPWGKGTSVTLKCYGKRRSYSPATHTIEYKTTDEAGNVTTGSCQVILAR